MGPSEVKAHLAAYEDRARRLREELAGHEHRLHVLEHPVLPEREYLKLARELEALEARGVAVALDSPSRRRGGLPRQRFAPAAHREPWLELPKVQSVAELRAYHTRLSNLDGGEPAQVASATVAGQEVVLTYIGGVLERAITRGDGREGQDLTDNARTIGSIPLVLRPAGSTTESRITKLTREALGPATISPVPSFPDELDVRGVIAMRISDVTALDRRRVDSGEPPYISPKAAVASSVLRLDPRITASRPLSFFAIGTDRMPPGLDGQWQLLGALKSWGFAVLPLTWRCSGLTEVLDFIGTLHQLAASFPYLLEGGRLSVNRLSFAARGHAAEAGGIPETVALVFPAPGRPAVVSNVYYAVGRGGAVLPVALLDKAPGQELAVPERAPIPAGAADAMLSVRRGASVRVRPGPVAPVLSLEDAAGPPPVIEQCPACARPLSKVSDEPFSRCDNAGCRGRARARLLHLIGPRGLRLESISVKVIDKLIADPGVLDAADLMALDSEIVDHIAPGKGEPFRQEIERTRKLPLWRFLYLLAIPHVSEHSARAIARHVFELGRLSRTTEKDCLDMIGVPPEAARGFARWVGLEAPRTLRRLREAGIDILDGVQSFPAPFLGTRICMGGELRELSQTQAIDEIERRGGTIVDRVARTTDFLVAGVNAGKALESAKHYGVTVIEEPALLSVLRST